MRCAGGAFYAGLASLIDLPYPYSLCSHPGRPSLPSPPPFAGFLSNCDPPLAASPKRPAVSSVGLITSSRTAYYMTRQVIRVFFGTERYAADEPGHSPEPHESPWVMTAPLVLLAGAAALGGGLNLPFGHRFEVLGNFLEPVFGHALVHPETTAGHKVLLAVIATAAAIVGVLSARSPRLHATDIPALARAPPPLRPSRDVGPPSSGHCPLPPKERGRFG